MARGDGIHRTSARNARMKDTDIDNAQAHNEREKSSYVNQDIVPERTPYNVHFKTPTAGYKEMFEQMRSDGVISTRGLKADAEKFGELIFDVNSAYIFSTRIENTRHDSSVSFDDRSAGFVWFFSFLIWFNYLQKKEDNLIILLDEPGLTLHAKAQGDLIRFFKEKITPKFQLLYTTHSPFMLDFSDILSARTVEDMTGEDDTVLGTKVGSKVLSKDRDTTFPLQAAFGYDITQTLFIGNNTLLVEGPSDILYLTYFSNKLKELGRTGLSSDWTLCPSGGIDKIQSFVSLFGGNALKIVTLTDYHNGDKNKIDRLKKSGLLSANRVFLASDYTQYPTSDIEDIIGKEPYIKLVNACYGLSADAKINGKNIKDGDVLHSVENVLSSNSEIRFDHYRPSMYLIQNPDIWTEKDISSALDRFEKLCTDINEAL